MSKTVELKGLKEALEAFDPRLVERAARPALNKTIRMARTGVFVTIDKASGQQHFPDAFMGHGKRGGGGLGYGEGALLVFHRKDNKLVHKAAITIASMFDQEPVQTSVMKKIDEVWPREFDRQLTRLMK